MQVLIAKKREILGKKVKNLRKEGLIPAVLYGKKKTSTPITLKGNEFIKTWKSIGESSILTLEVDGKKENVLIHDVNFDPVKDGPIHADFLVVEMDKPIKVEVKIEFTGESPAIKAGGSLIKVMHELHVEALPKDLPHEIFVDISSLTDMESSVKVADLLLPEKVKVLNNSGDIVVLVEAPKTEEQLKAEEAVTPSIENIEVVGKKEKEEEKEEETKEKPKEEQEKPKS